MTFYLYMKLTMSLCHGLHPKLKAECVDTGVKCYREWDKSRSGAIIKGEPYHCFELKK